MANENVTITIGAKDNASAAFRKVSDALKGVGDEGEKANKKLKSAGDTAKQLKGVLAGVVTVAALKLLSEYVDVWTNLNNKLKLVTDSANQLASTQAKLFRLAQETRQDLSSTVGLYSRLARSTKTLGLTQKQLLSITKTVNQAFVISGAGSSEAASAITQFGQALASGTLRGDELNSVMEQAPRLMEALTSALGITSGELRELAAQGLITSEILATALLEQAPKLTEEFGKTGGTIAQGWTAVTNAFTVFIGKLDETFDASGRLFTLLTDIANVLDDLSEVDLSFGFKGREEALGTGKNQTKAKSQLFQGVRGTDGGAGLWDKFKGLLDREKAISKAMGNESVINIREWSKAFNDGFNDLRSAADIMEDEDWELIFNPPPPKKTAAELLAESIAKGAEKVLKFKDVLSDFNAESDQLFSRFGDAADFFEDEDFFPTHIWDTTDMREWFDEFEYGFERIQEADEFFEDVNWEKVFDPPPDGAGRWGLLAHNIKQFFTLPGSGVFPAMSAGLKEFTDAIGTSFDIVKRATTQGLQTFRGGVQSAFGDLLFGDEERKEANKAAKELEDLLGRIPGLDLGTLTRGGGLAEASKDELSSIFDAALARDLPPSAVVQIERLRGEMFGVFAQPTSEGQDAFEESLTDTIASLTQKQSLLNKFKTFGDDMGDSAAEGLKAAITNGMADFTLKTLEQFVEWNYETWAKDVYQGLIGIVKQFVKWNYETWGKEVYQVLIAPLKQFVEWNYETWGKDVYQALIGKLKQFVGWDYDPLEEDTVVGLLPPSVAQGVDWSFAQYRPALDNQGFGDVGGGPFKEDILAWQPMDYTFAGYSLSGKVPEFKADGTYDINAWQPMDYSWSGADYSAARRGQGFSIGGMYDTAAKQPMGYDWSFADYNAARRGQGFSLEGMYDTAAKQPMGYDWSFADYNAARRGQGFSLEGMYDTVADQPMGYDWASADYGASRIGQGFSITGMYDTLATQPMKYDWGSADYSLTRRGQGFDIGGMFDTPAKQPMDYSWSGADYNAARRGQGFSLEGMYEAAAKQPMGYDWSFADYNAARRGQGFSLGGMYDTAAKQPMGYDFETYSPPGFTDGISDSPLIAEIKPEINIDDQNVFQQAFGPLGSIGQGIVENVGSLFGTQVLATSIAGAFGISGSIGRAMAGGVKAVFEFASGDAIGGIMAAIAAGFNMFQALSKGVTPGRPEERMDILGQLRDSILQGDISTVFEDGLGMGAFARTTDTLDRVMITADLFASSLGIAMEDAIDLVNLMNNEDFLEGTTGPLADEIARLNLLVGGEEYAALRGRAATGAGGGSAVDPGSSFTIVPSGTPGIDPDGASKPVVPPVTSPSTTPAVGGPDDPDGPAGSPAASLNQAVTTLSNALGSNSIPKGVMRSDFVKSNFTQIFDELFSRGISAGSEPARGLLLTVAGSPAAGSFTQAQSDAFWNLNMMGYGFTARRGLDRVPGPESVGVPAMLHGGERVLTAGQADAMDRGGGVSISNTFIIQGNGDEGILRLLREEAVPVLDTHIRNFLSRESRYGQFQMDQRVLRTGIN